MCSLSSVRVCACVHFVADAAKVSALRDWAVGAFLPKCTGVSARSSTEDAAAGAGAGADADGAALAVYVGPRTGYCRDISKLHAESLAGLSCTGEGGGGGRSCTVHAIVYYGSMKSFLGVRRNVHIHVHPRHPPPPTGSVERLFGTSTHKKLELLALSQQSPPPNLV